MPVTGIPVVDVVLQVVGALYTIASVIGNFLPNGNKVGEFLRQHSMNLRKAPLPRASAKPDSQG